MSKSEFKPDYSWMDVELSKKNKMDSWDKMGGKVSNTRTIVDTTNTGKTYTVGFDQLGQQQGTGFTSQVAAPMFNQMNVAPQMQHNMSANWSTSYPGYVSNYMNAYQAQNDWSNWNPSQVQQTSDQLGNLNWTSPISFGQNLYNTSTNGIDQYGWYDVDVYRNTDGGYFIGNNYLERPFPTTDNARTYELVNGQWVVTEQGDAWIQNLPSAGGRLMVGDSK